MTYVLVALYLVSFAAAIVLWLRGQVRTSQLLIIMVVLGLAALTWSSNERSNDATHDLAVRTQKLSLKTQRLAVQICRSNTKVAAALDQFHGTLRPFLLAAAHRLQDEIVHEPPGPKRDTDINTRRIYLRLGHALNTVTVIDCHVVLQPAAP